MTTENDAAKAGRQGAIDSGPISHDEAHAILVRYNNGHWNNTSKGPIYSIPADPKRDDDLRLSAYIEQQRAKDATIRELREKVRVLEQLSRDLHFAYTNKDGDAPHGFEEQALADYARLIATATDADPVCRERGKANG